MYNVKLNTMETISNICIGVVQKHVFHKLKYDTTNVLKRFYFQGTIFQSIQLES